MSYKLLVGYFDSTCGYIDDNNNNGLNFNI